MLYFSLFIKVTDHSVTELRYKNIILFASALLKPTYESLQSPLIRKLNHSGFHRYRYHLLTSARQFQLADLMPSKSRTQWRERSLKRQAKNRLFAELVPTIAEAITQIPDNKKPRKSLIYGVFKGGGRGRNRTGVGGFAIQVKLHDFQSVSDISVPQVPLLRKAVTHGLCGA